MYLTFRMHMIHAAALIIILLSLAMQPALSYSDEAENNGRKILHSCEVALEYLDNDNPGGAVEAVQFCNDYLTGFREDENIKDMIMGERYSRGYCFPASGITNAVLARVIVKYLHASEQEQRLDAYTAIRHALAEGYPCNH